MAAMLHRQQAQLRICCKRGVIVHRKRDKRVVFGLHQKRRDADAIEKLVGRLRSVIVISAAEGECLSGEPIVEIVDVPHQFQARKIEQAGRESLLRSDALLQPRDKSAGINKLDGLSSWRTQAARSMGVEMAITPAIKSDAELPSSPASFNTTLPPSEKPTRKIGADRGNCRITASRSDVWPE